MLAKQGFGTVQETSNTYTDLTARQNLGAHGRAIQAGAARAEQRSSDLLEMLGLTERRNQKVQAYSKGMKQRLILAMALLHEPEAPALEQSKGPTISLFRTSSQPCSRY